MLIKWSEIFLHVIILQTQCNLFSFSSKFSEIPWIFYEWFSPHRPNDSLLHLWEVGEIKWKPMISRFSAPVLGEHRLRTMGPPRNRNARRRGKNNAFLSWLMRKNISSKWKIFIENKGSFWTKIKMWESDIENNGRLSYKMKMPGSQRQCRRILWREEKLGMINPQKPSVILHYVRNQISSELF